MRSTLQNEKAAPGLTVCGPLHRTFQTYQYEHDSKKLRKEIEAVVYAESRLPVLRTGVCVPGRGVLSIPVHGPSSANRTACITRRTYVLRIIFKVLRLVYYCASVGADFYSFSYRTSCDLVARDQNLSPLAQPGFWR